MAAAAAGDGRQRRDGFLMHVPPSFYWAFARRWRRSRAGGWAELREGGRGLVRAVAARGLEVGVARYVWEKRGSALFITLGFSISFRIRVLFNYFVSSFQNNFKPN